MFYYYDDVIKLEDCDLNNLLTVQKSHENIFIYNISYKTLISSKPLPIRFFKIDIIIRIHYLIRYFKLCRSKEYEAIYNRTKYLISQKIK